jgi:hypothetical protein
MKTKLKIAAILLIAIFIGSCGKNLDNFKEIQSQKTGEYKVSVLSESNSFKQGSGTFIVEFRKASANELVKVDNISSEAVMQMEGMPMTGETTFSSLDTPGRYEVKYKFGMKGNWKFIVTFGNGMQVQFLLSVI